MHDNLPRTPWNELERETVYRELYEESRRFRDYQFEFAKWYVSVLLAFAGGYLALTTHGFVPGPCIRIVLVLVVAAISVGSVVVINHTDFRFQELKTYTNSIQPDFMKFDSRPRDVKPNHIIVFIIFALLILIASLVFLYPAPGCQNPAGTGASQSSRLNASPALRALW
jgi:hypothetical protein